MVPAATLATFLFSICECQGFSAPARRCLRSPSGGRFVYSVG